MKTKMKRFSKDELLENANVLRLRCYTVPTNNPMYCVILDGEIVGYVDYRTFGKVVDYSTKKWYYNYEMFDIIEK